MGLRKKLRMLFDSSKNRSQRINRLRNGFELRARSLTLKSYPPRLVIDPVNVCNLECVLCPSGLKTQGREQRRMSFDTFKKVIDECGPYIWAVALYNWGEPLLNKDIFKMVRYARGMKIDVSISANLNHFDDAMCEELVASGLGQLLVSLDGATQESVGRYQKGCDFELVLGNMRKIVEMKKRLASSTPEVVWRFLINKYNEHEVDEARRLVEEIGIDRLGTDVFRTEMADEVTRDSDAQFERVKDWLPVDESLSMYNYSTGKKKRKKRFCKSPWSSSVIQPDGAVSACCAVWQDKFDFGNINESSFFEIWNGDKYRDARRISRGDALEAEGHVCLICRENDAFL